jgi:hypothetical protein
MRASERKRACPSTKIILGPWGDNSETIGLDGMCGKVEEGKEGEEGLEDKG